MEHWQNVTSSLTSILLKSKLSKQQTYVCYVGNRTSECVGVQMSYGQCLLFEKFWLT